MMFSQIRSNCVELVMLDCEPEDRAREMVFSPWKLPMRELPVVTPRLDRNVRLFSGFHSAYTALSRRVVFILFTKAPGWPCNNGLGWLALPGNLISEPSAA